jgi:hypothetical protein
MRSLTVLLLTLAVIFSGCKSSEKATKEETKKTSKKEMKKEEDKKVKEDEIKKIEQEKLAKQEEERKAKEELEKKKMESDKQKEELRKVQENLKKMGLAALHVEFTKENDVLRYNDGKTIKTTSVLKDQDLLVKFNELLQKTKENEGKSMKTGGWCYGGYEACNEGKLFVYVVENKDCTGQWYATDGACK